MSTMALAIAGLAVAWALQGYGAWRQIQHYSAAMGDASRAWSDGFVGTGKARSRLGAGTLVMLVVDPDRVVRRLLVMRGVTVFARFRRLPEVEGLTLDAALAHAALRPATRAALKIAADQVDRAAARAREPRTDTGVCHAVADARRPRNASLSTGCNRSPTGSGAAA